MSRDPLDAEFEALLHDIAKNDPTLLAVVRMTMREVTRGAWDLATPEGRDGMEEYARQMLATLRGEVAA